MVKSKLIKTDEDKKKAKYLYNHTPEQKEQRRLYQKNKWLKEHIQVIRKNNNNILCNCGGVYTYNNFHNHNRTKKHQKYLLL